MSFRKPFRAVPVKPGAYYRHQQRISFGKTVLRYLGVAAIAGAIIGTSSVALTDRGRAQLLASVKPMAVRTGLARAREPQSGDFWAGCDDARAAGTAPIYSGEPGYRDGMDGDGDGVACEPYRGR